MIKIALFNHKGGVGKTTLTVNIANALADAGKIVLLVDADPQCNLTSFYIEEASLEKILEASDETEGGQTLWSAIKPVVQGRGGIVPIPVWQVGNESIYFVPGDVLLSDYEEELPSAWTECFARRTRGYDVTTALAQVANVCGESTNADICFYDMGPNVGALNRAVLLDCDFFITPVAADLFSLRALSTVGRSVAKWIADWQTIRGLASNEDKARIFSGKPAYLGYITSAFKVNAGRNATDPHADWERKIAPRVKLRVVDELRAVDQVLVRSGGNKVGGVKHFHSLAPEAQKYGVGIANLKGLVNSGHYGQIEEAERQFNDLAKEIIKRTGI